MIAIRQTTHVEIWELAYADDDRKIEHLGHVMIFPLIEKPPQKYPHAAVVVWWKVIVSLWIKATQISVWDGKLCMAVTKSDKRHSRTKSWENFAYNPSYFSCKNFIMSLKPGRPWELYFTQQISQLQKNYGI